MSTDVLPDVKTPVPAWRRLLVAAGWFALAMIAVSAAVYAVNRGRLLSQLDRETKALDEAEPGWRWPGPFESRPEVPAEENSVPRIQAILKRVPRGWPDYKVMEKWQDLKPNVALDPPRRKLFDALMATPPIPDLRPQARELVKYPRGRIDLVLTENPYAILLPEHQKMREAASLLSLDAWALALEGRPDEALRASRACLNVSRTLDGDPLLISQLIRIAIAAVAMGSAEKTMALGEPSDAALAELQKALEHHARSPMMVEALKGERAATHQMLSLIAAGKMDVRDIEGPGSGDKMWGLGWLLSATQRELARREHADILKLMNQVVEASRLPVKDQFAAEAAVEQQIKTGGGPMLRMLVPAVSKVSQAGRRGMAAAVSLRALIAVERYRQKHKAWPAKLDDVVPAFLDKVPEDPMDGKPIRYARWSDGVVVYSIGNDRVDGGGDVEKMQNDFGYRLWDADKRRAAPPPLPPEAPPEGEAGEPPP